MVSQNEMCDAFLKAPELPSLPADSHINCVSCPVHKMSFGSLVSFYPSGPRAQLLPQFGTRQIPGIFIGYHTHCGGKWSGDYLVVSCDDYRGSECETTIRVQRIEELTLARVLQLSLIHI